MNIPLAPEKKQILQLLDEVVDPETGKGLAQSGRVQGLVIRPDGKVGFTIEAPTALIDRYGAVRDAAEAAVRAAPGVTGAAVVLTAHTKREPQRTPPERRAEGLPGVERIIAVASAKGGVGKSTVAVNLACAFARLGLRTGLLDVDVYGPSGPTMLGTVGTRPGSAGGRGKPIEAWGLKTMSIGNLVDPEQPMVWRGPMATNAFREMLDGFEWAPLDVLVLDLPPGTGDVQLTLVQRLPLDGVVIVSTPQELALADVRRGIVMFEKTHAPILGIVENMAWFETPDGARLPLFGEGGARRTAAAQGVPLLGEIPIDVRLRESCDAGRPLVASEPDHPVAQRFLGIAEAALANIASGAKPPPIIRFD
jgi:ATP-binding protein involved in chromosome partitioning